MRERKIRRRYERAGTPAPMVLTERDREVIEAVHLYRVLRQDQIQRLFFADSASDGAAKTKAQRRLVQLYDHGYLERRFLPVLEGQGKSPTLYVLDRKGAELLRAERGYEDLTWYSSSRDLKTDFLGHTMAISDFRIAVTLACKGYGFTLLEWQDENQMKADYDRVNVRLPSGKNQLTPIVPDSHFAMDMGQGEKRFCLELDRGTMQLSRYKSKILGYIAYHQSGAYEKRFGTKSMRVLTVAIGEKRLDSLKKTAEEAGGERRYWFALMSEITPENVLTGEIWRVAGSETLAAIATTS